MRSTCPLRRAPAVIPRARTHATRTHVCADTLNAVSGEVGEGSCVVGVGTGRLLSNLSVTIRRCSRVAISMCLVRDNVLVASKYATVLITSVLLYWREWRNIYMTVWQCVTNREQRRGVGSESFRVCGVDVSRPPLYQNPASPTPLCAVHRVVRASSGAVRGALEWSASQLRSVAGGESRSERGLAPCGVRYVVESRSSLPPAAQGTGGDVGLARGGWAR